MTAIDKIVTPQEARARLIASYTNSYRRAQIRMSGSDIERQVLADLEIVDAARRAGDLGDGTPVKRDTVGPSSRSNLVEDTAKMYGHRIEIDRKPGAVNPRAYRPAALYRNPQMLAERWGYAVARCQRIIEGSGGSSSLTAATANAEVPKLAKELLEVYAYYFTRSKSPPKVGADHNPFRHLTDKDASRMFIRKVEDICDRSTGVLGSWYTK